FIVPFRLVIRGLEPRIHADRRLGGASRFSRIVSSAWIAGGIIQDGAPRLLPGNDEIRGRKGSAVPLLRIPAPPCPGMGTLCPPRARASPRQRLDNRARRSSNVVQKARRTAIDSTQYPTPPRTALARSSDIPAGFQWRRPAVCKAQARRRSASGSAAA